MTGLSKVLLASCIGLSVAVIHLSREQVTPTVAYNNTPALMIRNPWSGTVQICSYDRQNCAQTYPAIKPPTVAKAAAIPSNRPGNGAAEDDAAKDDAANGLSPGHSQIIPRQPTTK